MKKRLPHCLALLLLLPLNAVSEENRGVFFSLTRYILKDFIRPQDFTVLDKNEVAEQRPATAADLLNYIPSVLLRSAGKNSVGTVSMRGFSSRRVAIVLDDVKIPADITGTVDVTNLPSENIQKVEVMPGAWSSVYGANAEGGVIHLLSGRLNPGTKTAEAGDEWESYGGRASFVKTGAASGPAEVFFTGRSAYSSGFQQNSASNKNSFTGRASYDFGGAGKISLKGFDTVSYNGLPTGTPVPISGWDGKKEREANSLTDFQTGEVNLLSAGYDVSLGGGVRLSVNSSLGNNILDARQWYYGFLSRTLIKTRNRAASAKLSLPWDSVLGAEYGRDMLTSPTYGGHSMKTWGFYAQNIIRPAPGLEIMPGLRYDANEHYSNQLSPKLALVYSPSFNWKFSAQSGKAWQAPTFADLYDPYVPASDRSPGLKPESSIHSQAGAQWNSDCGFYISATEFYSDVKNRIALNPVKNWAAYNLDSAFNLGSESEAGYKSGAFRATLAYSWLLSKGRESSGAYKLLQFSPKRRFTALAGFKTGPADIFARAKYVSRQYTGLDGTGIKLPPYFTADIYVTRSFGAVELGAGADNILDRHYAETADSYNGYFPQPGRTLKASLKISFI
ncbi:MAG: TonB-dependent receptor [Elusimicrobia bacterium]|nr:TonB-dependent receptor [Elusimicrobiota bacterium]